MKKMECIENCEECKSLDVRTGVCEEDVKLEQIIQTVEENLELDNFCGLPRADDCPVTAICGNREKVKKWISEIINS